MEKRILRRLLFLSALPPLIFLAVIGSYFAIEGFQSSLFQKEETLLLIVCLAILTIIYLGVNFILGKRIYKSVDKFNVKMNGEEKKKIIAENIIKEQVIHLQNMKDELNLIQENFDNLQCEKETIRENFTSFEMKKEQVELDSIVLQSELKETKNLLNESLDNNEILLKEIASLNIKNKNLERQVLEIEQVLTDSKKGSFEVKKLLEDTLTEKVENERIILGDKLRAESKVKEIQKEKEVLAKKLQFVKDARKEAISDGKIAYQLLKKSKDARKNELIKHEIEIQLSDRKINLLTGAIERARKGDLTKLLPVGGGNVASKIGSGVNAWMNNLRNTFLQLEKVVKDMERLEVLTTCPAVENVNSLHHQNDKISNDFSPKDQKLQLLSYSRQLRIILESYKIHKKEKDQRIGNHNPHTINGKKKSKLVFYQKKIRNSANQ